MNTDLGHPLRITWLAPDDRGGGVISVVQACCRQATQAGLDTTLLLLLAPTGHAAEFGGSRVESLNGKAPYADAPAQLVEWLKQNRQDVLVLNGCEEADVAIPYVPAETRVVYAVHDTASRYFEAAVRHEARLDAIVAVSETVAERLRERLNDPGKLHVLMNGTLFPAALEAVLASPREDDLVFLGGDNPVKGAYDVLALWTSLQAIGFKGKLHWFGHIGKPFQSQIHRLPGFERIESHGRQLRQKVFDVAGRSKALLMLSRVEPFGMVTVECMGMGCIPVAWDIATGTKEIVGDGEGLFAPLGDYEALARAVLKAIDIQPARFAAIAARIRRDFSEEAMWARYQALMADLSARPPATRPLAGQPPPPYRPPTRLFQLLPSGLKAWIRMALGKSPRLGFAFRDLRGR